MTASHLITAQVVVGVASFVINAMSARTMGPAGRGGLALLLQITYVANLIAVAGVDRSYPATAPPEQGVRGAVRDILRLVAPTAAVVIVAATTVASVIDSGTPRERLLAAGGLALTASSLMAASVLRTAAAAAGATRPYLLAAVTGQLALLASAALLTAAHVESPEVWLVVYGASLSAGPLVAWLRLRRFGAAARVPHDLTAARRLGLRLVPAALAGMVMLRGDRLLLPWLGSYDDLGLYIVVATLSEFAIWPIQNYLDAQAPRWHQRFLTGDLRGRGPLLIACGYGAAVALLLLVAGRALVVPVFGAEYRDSTVLLLPLSVGTACLCVSRAAIGLSVAAGRSRVALAADIPAMVVCLAGCLLLIPRYGALGAAIASALAYGVGAVLALLVCGTAIRRPSSTAPERPAPLRSVPAR